MSVGVFRVCEVADKKTIKHDKPRNINEYSRCTPGKIPKDLRSLAFSSRYYPINPYNRFTPNIPKINKHVCSFRAVWRCWPNIGPSLPMSEDVPGKSNVVYRCTLAICGFTYETCRFSHRAPQSGQCKPGLRVIQPNHYYNMSSQRSFKPKKNKATQSPEISSQQVHHNFCFIYIGYRFPLSLSTIWRNHLPVNFMLKLPTCISTIWRNHLPFNQ